MKSKELNYVASFDEIVSIYADYTPDEIAADEDLSFQVDRAASVIAANDFTAEEITCEATHEYEPRTRPVFKTKEQVLSHAKKMGWID